tara:strand:+ start:555 stop:1154 length:600 start_codon:yes stop_codon:yes gene_type:complete
MKLNRRQLRRLIESQIPELTGNMSYSGEVPIDDDTIDKMLNYALMMVQDDSINESINNVNVESAKQKSIEIAKNVSTAVLEKIEGAVKNENVQEITKILTGELIRLLPGVAASYIAANIGGFVVKAMWIIKNVGFAGLLKFSGTVAVSAQLGSAFAAGFAIVMVVAAMLLLGQYTSRVVNRVIDAGIAGDESWKMPTFY